MTPTRTVWGLGDPCVPDQQFAAKLLRLPQSGHWVPIVAAAQAAEHVADCAAG